MSKAEERVITILKQYVVEVVAHWYKNDMKLAETAREIVKTVREADQQEGQ